MEMMGTFNPFGPSGGGGTSSEDMVARAEIAAIKDGEILNSFGDVEAALDNKVDKEKNKGLSTNDYTTNEKEKLAGIEAQANKTVVDSALSGVSTNPVQNKVIKSALDNKANTADIPIVPITAIQKNGIGIAPVSGTVNITVPTQASDINAATATQGSKADTAIQGIKVNNSTVSPDSNKVINITIPTTAADVSALPNTTKYAAELGLTINSSTYVVSAQLKDQNGNNLGTVQTIDLPLESVVVNGAYNDTTKKIILTLQNGNTVEFSVADLVAGLQTELSASNKLNPAYINYNSTHRAVSDTEKSTWNGKQSALSSTQLSAVNSGIDSTKVGQISVNQTEITRLVNDESKNVLNITKQSVKAGNTAGTWSGDTYTRNGMSITMNNDMTFTVSGTATGIFDFILKQSDLTGLQGYILSGGNPNSNTVSMLFQMKVDPWTNLAQDFGTGVPIAQYDDSKQVAVSIHFSNGATANNLLIKPMICSTNSWSFSHDFMPYVPSNAELYAMIQALQS